MVDQGAQPWHYRFGVRIRDSHSARPGLVDPTHYEHIEANVKESRIQAWMRIIN